MPAEIANIRQVQGYCGLCIARCGTVATVVDGRFARLDPDPTHPTGAAICAKGRAAPELVYHKDRLKRPLRRTRPKGDPDPGWEEISWDTALDQIAAAMRSIAEQHGPEAVAFSQSSTSPTAIADSAAFVRRLMNAFGTPNLVWPLDLCGAPDEKTYEYLKGRPKAPKGAAWDDAMRYWETLRTHHAGHFDREIKLDAAKLPPLVTWGTNPEQVVAITGRVPIPAEIADGNKRRAAMRSLEYMGLNGGERIADIAVDGVSSDRAPTRASKTSARSRAWRTAGRSIPTSLR
jgi:hypothetical protein